MRKSIKQQWIEAYETTLIEYKENRHESSQVSCTKCIFVDSCEQCPENIFIIYNKEYNSDSVGCTKRKHTKADSSRRISKHHRTKIIRYHKGAIVYLKSIKRFNLTTFSNKLVKIDRDINK